MPAPAASLLSAPIFFSDASIRLVVVHVPFSSHDLRAAPAASAAATAASVLTISTPSARIPKQLPSSIPAVPLCVLNTALLLAVLPGPRARPRLWLSIRPIFLFPSFLTFPERWPWNSSLLTSSPIVHV
ncbi:hypothetical protein LZ30DRAFT_685596 [Colletotrichum cereale]|nr:hypothetical protein LZ30DRAFT_685596 [Colletotrichum cereale]